MKRSLFDLSHTNPFTCNLGQVVPIACYEVVPGDRIRADSHLFMRTQPLLAPVMHKVDVIVHHWFVPNRILWNNGSDDSWESFITTGLAGDSFPTFPTITFGNTTDAATGTLADYLGIPSDPSTGDGINGLECSALPFRAYASIINNWYQDEQLDTPLTIDTTGGADSTTNTTLQYAAWSKDYFTSARPEPQLGSEVSIPLTGDAPVQGIGVNNASPAFSQTTQLINESNGVQVQADNTDGNRYSTALFGRQDATDTDEPDIYADLSDVSAVNINDLRTASALQRFKEKLNRKGARYNEFIRSFFGVTPADQRLQLPEYLGGGRATIQFSEVLQTAEGTDPVGELRGHGIAAGKSNRFKYFAPEHGHIVSVMITRPKAVYMQGLHKMWNRRSPYDYLVPEFSNLGDQAILNKELYAEAASPEDTLGYTGRFDEYRTIPNRISGEFRTSLDYWTLGRVFASEPALNSSFINMANVSNRIFATDADQLQIQCVNKIKAKRPLPKKSNPKLM
jgi:hypothetical protein